MNELDTKISQLEKKLARLQNLAAQIPTVQADLAALRRAKDLLGFNSTNNGETPSEAKAAMTILDAAVIVLKEAGERMHVERIHKGVVALGLNVKQASVVAALSRGKDKDGARIKLYGKNVFGLVEGEAPVQ